MQEGSILCLTDEYVAGLASEDYAQVMKSISVLTDRITFENEFFETRIMKMKAEPDLEPAGLSSGMSVCLTIRLRRLSNSILYPERHVRLSGEHKCQLARDALEDTAKEITFASKDFTSIITDLQITQEDLKITLSQIKRFRKYLQTQVVSVLDNPHRKLEARDAFMRYHKRILKDLATLSNEIRMTAEMSRRLKSLNEQNANIRDEIDRLRDSQTVLQRQLDHRKTAIQNYKLPTIGDWVELYITNRTVDKRVQIQARYLKNAKSRYERHKQLWTQVKRGI